jgi:signal transduction histidine kinase
MTQASLRFSSDLLKRLGEELTPSPVNGIVELVKNAYDANATRVEVKIVQPSGLNGKIIPGSLTITDNGDGMTSEDFRNGWLVLGRSRKDSTKPTRLGRKPVGDKGLGRLTAMRMGADVEVVSRPRAKKGSEFSLDISWRKFDKVASPEAVKLEVRRRTVPSNHKYGTKISITGIVKRLDHYEVERLNRALILLSNPFVKAQNSFAVDLAIEPAPKGLISNSTELFQAAAFRLDATVDSAGSLESVLFDGEGKELSRAGKNELLPRFRDASPDNLIPLRFQLWIFVFKEEQFPAGKKQMSAAKAWLKDYGGIHVFVDGVRVSPYGDPNDDWVGVNALRAGSPELTPTTKSSIGYVALPNSGDFVQKTDRTGFIEGPALGSVREFIRAAVRWQQSFRIAQRQVKEDEQEEKRRHDVASTVKALDSLFVGLPSERRAQANQLLSDLTTITARHEDSLKREIALYQTLGTAGIAASVFAHEAANNQLARIKDNVDTIAFRADKFDPKFGGTIRPISSLIRRDVESLESISSITLALIKAKKRKKQKVVVGEVLSSVAKLFLPYTELHGISVQVPGEKQGLIIFGSRAAFECIVVNLVTNAVQALDRDRPEDPVIRVSARLEGKYVEIEVADSGPGIVDIAPSEVWLPGETTREDGTGLGLAIVRAAARDLGGNVSAERNSDLGGAAFKVRIPLMVQP